MSPRGRLAHVWPARLPPAGGTITRVPGAPSTPQGRPAHDRVHLPKNPYHAFSPAYDLDNELQQIRIVIHDMSGYIPIAMDSHRRPAARTHAA